MSQSGREARPTGVETLTRRMAAAGLLAFAGLTAELAWTRIAGLLFYGDVAWAVVTLAVAGLSIGAAMGAARPAWLAARGASAAAVVAGLAIALGLAAVLAANGRGGVPWAASAALPGFAALGMALAGLFARNARQAPRLYAADLTGAALAATLSLPLIATLGAPDALLVAAAAAAAAGVALAPVGPGRGLAGAFAFLLAVGVALPGPVSDPGRTVSDKSMTRELARGGELLATRWGSVGRSDLVRRADGAEILYLDGAAGSLLPTPSTSTLWRSDLGRFAFEVLRPERVFVVGAGAGLEVAHALETGAERVDAVELNGAGTALARERLDGLGTSSDPFRDPRVHGRVDEARATLRALDRRYDLITLSQAVTRTAEARGLALSENGLYTVEATEDLLRGLASNGAIAYELYDEATLTRTLLTAAVALQDAGLASSDAAALRHQLAFLDPRTSPPTPLLLVLRTEPSEADVVAWARAAEARGYGLLLLPDLLAPAVLEPVTEGRAGLAEVIASAPDVDLAPVRDDGPFYWAFEPGVPRGLRRALIVAAIGTLGGGAVLVLLRRRGTAVTGRRRGLVAAGVLGSAFLALEIAVLSRTGLFLGHPSAALAITLAGLLAGAGAGAVWARRRPERWRSLVEAALVATVAAAMWTWAWPWLADLAGGWPAWQRAALTLITLLPLGAALGSPFPLLLRQLGRTDDGAADAASRSAPSGTVARAWALNGAGSLLGGIGAIAVAHVSGFTVVALTAAALYLSIAALAATIRPLPG